MLRDAHAALQSENLDQAEIIAQAGLANELERGMASSILAAIALRRGDPEESLRWAVLALELGQQDIMTLSNAGEAYRRLGNLQSAADHFERALRIDNLNALLHFNMAVVMRQMGNAPLAEHFFRSSQIADPGMWQAYSNLAELYRDEGHLREAEVEYRNAIRANPNEARPMERLGNLLLELGHTMAAVDVLEAADRLTGGSVECLSDLAKAYFEICYESPACIVLSNALAISSQSPDLMNFHVEAVRRKSFESMRVASSGEFGVLAKEHRLQVSLPQTFPKEESANFILGIPHAPEIFWARMHDVRVIPKEFSIVADGRSLHVDGIVNWAQFYRQRGIYVHHESDDMRVLLKIPKQIREVKESCALLGGSGDWFSWIYECMPRLWTVEQIPNLQQTMFIVPDNLSVERVEMLARFGVGPERLIRQAETECILARDLFVPSLLTVGDWVSPIALQYLRRGLSQSTVIPPFRRIFTFRSVGCEQAVKNLDEVIARLRQEGFEIVDLSRLSISKRIKLFSEAAAVVGMDDDDLALMPILPQGAWVGAITPRGRYYPRLHLVSMQLGIQLVYLFGDPHFEGGRALDKCDVVMPIDIIDRFLSRMSTAPE